MSCWWKRAFVVAAVVSGLSLGLTGRSVAENDDCDPAALEQAVAACGMDIGCITQATADYNSACTGGTGGIGGFVMGGMDTDMMQRLQACGSDQDCYERVMEDMQSQLRGEDADSDSTSRLHERTALAPSWLQTYQETLVNCGIDVACWTTEMMVATGHIQSCCGTNMMSESTRTCHISALYEIHVEQAIAQQRLWRQGIRFDGEAPGATPPGVPDSPVPGADSVPADGSAGTPDAVFSFLPDVSNARVLHILSEWEDRVEGIVPQEGREKIAAGAAAIPLEGEEGLPSLIYEETETPEGLEIEARPTRRDWYYALTGVLLTHAGLVEGGERGGLLLDTALWCLIQAAKLNPEAEHYSNIGFHLNLRGEVEQARDVLVYARELAPNQPDTDNNLAFSYSAMGKPDEALALQQSAARLDPRSDHIRTRLHAMLGLDKAADATGPMPHGGDFGETFFRFGKRHSLREYWAGKDWFKARQTAKNGIFGGSPSVPGPRSWYAEQLRDIDEDYSACTAGAPVELRGCPFGAFVVHPDCEDSPTPQQVERSLHNRAVALCECKANAIMARADALSAYLDRSVAAWMAHEKAWWQRLNHYARYWSEEIKGLNAGYQGSNFKLPVETAYWYWIEEFREDSKEAWKTDIPEIAEGWHELKSQVQRLKACGTRLPPIEKPPKKPPPEPEEKVSSYGINLFVVSIKLGMDGNFKANFDLGFIKGGYERVAGTDGHKFEIGSGPIEFSYQTNASPRPGGDSSKVSMTVGTNFLSFIPGAGKVAAKIADQFISFGAKYEMGWGNKSGYSGKSTVESKSKIGFTTRDVKLAPATRMLN